MIYNEEQKSIIEETAHFVQVIAGAGSGKTSTMIGILDRLIRSEKEDCSKVLVVTFSRKAAREFSERLKKIHPSHSIRIQTFHAHCLKVIKDYHPEFNNKPPKILTEKDRESFFKNFFKLNKFRIGGIPYKYILEQNLLILRQYFPDLYEEAMEEFQNYKKLNRKLEFNDLVAIYLNSLEKKEEWTQEPKSNIRRLIVDEFQDTDEEQLRFLKFLEPEYLTVVGDDWQAIYGFRGATPRPFLDFAKHFHPVQRHFLATNYRSLPEIVEVSQKPILQNNDYIPKIVKAERKGKSKLELWTASEAKLDMQNIAQKILENIHNIPDTKILCRTNFRKKEFSLCGIPEDHLMTIHSSKGLEFDAVYVDLISGWNQNPKSIPIGAMQEERRILYVALSRAKNDLILLGNRELQKTKKLEDLFFSYFIKGSKKIKQVVAF
jgi:DNA helicase-2/ATP-dependent DNA helicase PcrA